jgi:hypothetical protein
MRLRHRKYKILISAVVDGELSGDARQELEEHLSDCAECARTLKDFRLLEEMRGSAKAYRVDPFYLTRLRAVLDKPAAVSWGASEIEAKLFTPLLAVLVLALIFLFSIAEKPKVISSEDYLIGGRRTLVEQQLLSHPGGVSQDEVLLLTVSSQGGEESSER